MIVGESGHLSYTGHCRTSNYYRTIVTITTTSFFVCLDLAITLLPAEHRENRK